MSSDWKSTEGGGSDKAALGCPNNNAMKKKRKRSSPFRIKAGCVVALRYPPNGKGNHVTMVVPPDTAEVAAKKPTKHALRCLVGMEGHAEVWTDPIAGRDEGLALIGRRVRCCFTRPVKEKKDNNTSSEITNNGNGASTEVASSTMAKTKNYIIEGEIVSIPNYGTPEWNNEREEQRQNWQENNDGIFPWFEVELLIHRDLLTTTPFLQRTDEDIDVHSLKKESAKRAYKNEELIKGGAHLVTVKARLTDPSSDIIISGNGIGNGSNGISKAQQKQLRKNPVAKWAIRKRIPNNPGYPWEDPSRIINDANKKSDEGVSSKSKPAIESTTNNNENSSKKNGAGPSPTPGKSAAKLVDGNTSKKDDAGKKKHKSNNGTSSKKQNSSPTQYMGNGHDDAAAQQKNWRWFAARYFDICLSNSPHLVTASRSGSSDMVQSIDSTICNRATIPSFYDYYSELLSSCGGGLVGEVIEVTPSSRPGTLAMVTMRRLILPQHAASTHNFAKDDLLEVFDDYDSLVIGRKKAVLDNSNPDNVMPSVLFRVPIEELVIVSRKIARVFQKQDSVLGSSDEFGAEELVVNSSYSWRGNCSIRLKNMVLKNSEDPSVLRALTKKRLGKMSICHHCRTWFPHAAVKICENTKCPLKPARLLHDGDSQNGDDVEQSFVWCRACRAALQAVGEIVVDSNQKSLASQKLPCCLGLCDCRHCKFTAAPERMKNELFTQVTNISAANGTSNDGPVEDRALAFSDTVLSIKSMPEVNFDLPAGLIDLSLLPHLGSKVVLKTKAPVTAKKAKKTITLASTTKQPAVKVEKRKRESTSPTKKGSKRTRATSPRPKTPPPKLVIPRPRRVSRRTSEDYSVFKPTCSRLLDYDAAKALRKRNSDEEERLTLGEMTSGDKPRNLRELQLKNSPLLTIEKDEKVTSSRAFRANQRRLARDVSSFGSSSLNFDTLVGRESQLRFDRSTIHAWGVFADGEISAGDMIVEYRGELIGNAMAEKREREYELAKIGSDYMFRIDNLIVCDATKQGNVARFINASCDPNCYTKIITLDGRQRIVIYAKKDIKVGEELCYDYKFALEYDESQRIPCHCGAQECRGFMNWVSW